MRRLGGILLAALLATASPAGAQEVTVTGVGESRDSALRDAARNAVEQIVGTMIESRTLVRDAMVELDEIYKQSRGFVKNISILEEQGLKDGYRVRARIDVDDSPGGQLMNQLAALLGDPRIAVIVLDGDSAQAVSDPLLGGAGSTGASGHDAVSEASLNDRLIEIGFSHVMDASHLTQLRDARLLANIYRGQTGLKAISDDRSVDYLVLGESHAEAGKIRLPNQAGAGFTDAPLAQGRASLTVKILKFDTGELAGTFSVEGQGIENTPARAKEKAKRDAATKAAQMLEEKFRKFGAKATFQGLQVVLSAKDYGKLEQAISALRGLDGIQNVRVREHGGETMALDVETVRPPHEIARLLKERSKLNIFVESISGSKLQLRLA